LQISGSADLIDVGWELLEKRCPLWVERSLQKARFVDHLSDLNFLLQGTKQTISIIRGQPGNWAVSKWITQWQSKHPKEVVGLIEDAAQHAGDTRVP
jgi:hypothetical protein